MMNNMKGGGMMKQIMQMQKQLKQTQKELERETVTGSAGDGAVQVILTGSQKYHDVKLDSDKIEGMTADKLEKLFGQALSNALEKSRKLMAEKLGPLGGGLPGMKF